MNRNATRRPCPSCISQNGEFTGHDFHRALVVSVWGAVKVWFCPYCLYVMNEDGTVREQTPLANEQEGEYLVFPAHLEYLMPKEKQQMVTAV